MGIFDILKRKKTDKIIKKDNIETIFIQKTDVNTKLIIFYECNINLDTGMVTSKILDSKPNNQEIYELDECVNDKYDIYKYQIFEAINKCEDTLNRQFESDDNYFQMSDLYNLKDIENNDKILNSYKKYKDLKNKLISKCHSLNLDIKSDEQEIFNHIIDEIEYEYVKRSESSSYKRSANIDFCNSKENIDIEVKNQLNNKYNSRKFIFAKFYLTDYYASYIQCFSRLLNLLNKNNLSENEKIVLKNYTELFSILPAFINRLDYLEYCANEIENEKINKNKIKLEQNQQFINDLTNLFSEVDTNREDLHIHATTNEVSAKSIIDKGLYIYSDDLDTFSFPYQNFEQIFTYQYGGFLPSTQVGDWIVIFRMPKNEVDFVNLDEDEKNEAMSFINMRRNSVIVPPEKKISPSNILGIIDKKNMLVIQNDKFKPNDYNKNITR